MNADSKEIAEMIRSGTYYEESRAWYDTVYIGPISERSFFLLIASLGCLVALVAFFALMAFLPLTDRVGILIATTRIDETIPNVVPIKENGSSPNTALMRFWIANYVTKREGYAADSYESNYNFVVGQSDAAVGQEYNARYSREVPQSPAAILGKVGRRVVTITNIRLDDKAAPKKATVEFSTDIQGYAESRRTNWTAVLQFQYTDLLVAQVRDPATGKETLKTQDPKFQVVGYALTQAK